MNIAVEDPGSMRIDVEAHDNAMEIRRRRRIALHHQGVVPRHDVLRRWRLCAGLWKPSNRAQRLRPPHRREFWWAMPILPASPPTS